MRKRVSALVALSYSYTKPRLVLAIKLEMSLIVRISLPLLVKPHSVMYVVPFSTLSTKQGQIRGGRDTSNEACKREKKQEKEKNQRTLACRGSLILASCPRSPSTSRPPA